MAQADGQIGSLGYVAAAVTGESTPTATIPGGANQHESFPVAVVIGVAAAAVLMAGLALGIRNSRRRPSPKGRATTRGRPPAKRR